MGNNINCVMGNLRNMKNHLNGTQVTFLVTTPFDPSILGLKNELPSTLFVRYVSPVRKIFSAIREKIRVEGYAGKKVCECEGARM